MEQEIEVMLLLRLALWSEGATMLPEATSREYFVQANQTGLIYVCLLKCLNDNSLCSGYVSKICASSYMDALLFLFLLIYLSNLETTHLIHRATLYPPFLLFTQELNKGLLYWLCMGVCGCFRLAFSPFGWLLSVFLASHENYLQWAELPSLLLFFLQQVFYRTPTHLHFQSLTLCYAWNSVSSTTNGVSNPFWFTSSSLFSFLEDLLIGQFAASSVLRVCCQIKWTTCPSVKG